MLFPMGIATGEAFYNRDQERKILKENIMANRHTVLLAPRLYGKTSLVTEVILQLGLPSCNMNFLLAADARSVETILLDKIGGLLFSMLPKTIKAKEKLLAIFRKFRPEITLSSTGQTVKLHATQSNSSIEVIISEALLNLDKVAKVTRKRLVVFMDEFQQLGQLRDQHVMEASVRHAVERSQNVSFIFSGSNRHLLLQMFSDKDRPFYQLCTFMTLKRISEINHTDFIQVQAKKKWKKPLGDGTLHEILQLSESHPYYVNLICNYIWQSNGLPATKKVRDFWLNYIETQKSVISYDLATLSNNQKRVLKDLATYPANQPYSNENLLRTRLTIASQKEAIKKLILKDYIYEDALGFLRVLDPAVRSFILLLHPYAKI